METRDSLTLELDTVRTINRESQFLVSQLQSDKASIESQILEYQTRFESQRISHSDLEGSQDSLQKKLTKTLEELVTFKEFYDKNLQDQSKLTSEVVGLRVNHVSMSEKISTLESQVSTLDELTSRYKKMKRLSDDRKKALDETESSLSSLQSDFSRIKSDWDNKKRKVETLEGSLSMTRSELGKVKGILELKTGQVEDFEMKIKDFHKDSTTLKTVTSQLDSWRRKTLELEERHFRVRQEKETLGKALEAVQTQLEAQERKISVLSRKKYGGDENETEVNVLTNEVNFELYFLIVRLWVWDAWEESKWKESKVDNAEFEILEEKLILCSSLNSPKLFFFTFIAGCSSSIFKIQRPRNCFLDSKGDRIGGFGEESP